jgi:hypothetical protein
MVGLLNHTRETNFDSQVTTMTVMVVLCVPLFDGVAFCGFSGVFRRLLQRDTRQRIVQSLVDGMSSNRH